MANTVTVAQHQEMAQLWARWNGQRGTEKQAARIMRTLRADDLVRMLGERGVVLPASVQPEPSR